MSTQSSVAGAVGQSLTFNGSTNYVSMTDFLYSDTLSVCTWFKSDNFNNSVRNMVVKRNVTEVTEGGFEEWVLFSYDSGSGSSVVRWISWDTSVVITADLTGVTRLSPNEWYHVCAVQAGSGNSGYIYLNGVQDGTATQAGATRNTAAPIQIGARTNGDNTRYWDGSLDDVRIYNRALSAEEVKRLYQLGQ
jgi:hypothetical protein